MVNGGVSSITEVIQECQRQEESVTGQVKFQNGVFYCFLNLFHNLYHLFTFQSDLI